MNKILIGYDGEDHGHDALALGTALADATGATEVLVVSVYTALLPKNSHGEPCLREERFRYEAEQRLARARASMADPDGWSWRAVRAGSPSAGLHRCALDGGFDVIVVGASHRHGLGRIFADSVTEQTLQGSPRPVAVAPPGYASAADEPTRMQRIGVAYDGSVEARRAIDLAADLARRADATVVAIDVVETFLPPLTRDVGYGGLVRDMREIVERQLADAQEALATRGVASVELRTREGGIARELIAESGKLDLLLLGSRCHGPALRLLLGSVSSHVVREAACPVLLQPRAATVSDERSAADETVQPA